VEPHLIPAREARTEIRVVNSRFVATVAPVFSVAEARTSIDGIRSEFADASHNVPAYLIGHGATVVAHCHDNGEPSGTAGRPALAVLRGSGLGDVAVVVTRYFGGTKLGKGGLVRAYSDAVREVLSVLPRAVKVPTHTVEISAPYSCFERLRLLIKAHHGQILQEGFAEEVTITAQFTVRRVPGFRSALLDISNGRLTADVVETNESTIMPIGTDGVPIAGDRRGQERGGSQCRSES
jgi:uncharacterized YigZ family protein